MCLIGGGLFFSPCCPDWPIWTSLFVRLLLYTTDWPRFLASRPRRPVFPRDGPFRIDPLVI
jgi:hypothetical protein